MPIHFYSDSKGFTLMEVLVAVALVGISIGVILSGFALGHRQAARGILAKEAAQLAERLLYELSSEERPLENGTGDFEGHPGWKYEITLDDVQLTILSADGGEEAPIIIDDDNLQKVNLTIIPPGKKPKFSTSFLMKQVQ